MNDLISRQAAIEAVHKYWIAEVHKLPRKMVGEYEVLDGDYKTPTIHNKKICEAIEALPSAQPERTCVNCGRTANNGGWYADGGTRCPIEEHYALPKDGYCYLWEKRNVTDDDYPERRTDG